MSPMCSRPVFVATASFFTAAATAADIEVHDTSGAPSTALSTSTTTPYCFEDSVSWDPLDMEGIAPSNEQDAFSCQQKCLDTDGCYHFSYWQKFGTCHLQDAFALRRDYQADYTSGPFQCWSDLEDAGLVKVGVEQFLPKQFSCMQVGQSWEPVMQWRSGHVLAGGQADQIMACQALCARTPKCAHFTMDVSTRTCKLVSDEAWQVSGVLHSISGPPKCEKDPTHYFMRKFVPGEVHDPGFFRGATIVAVGLATLSAFAAFIFRRSRQQPSQDLLVEKTAVLEEAMAEEAE